MGKRNIYRKTNTLDMKKTITESQLRQIVKESVKKALKEKYGDDFTPHASRTITNLGGYEMELSPDGESARFREAWGNENPKVSRWIKIRFTSDGRAYVMLNGRRESLENYMRQF